MQRTFWDAVRLSLGRSFAERRQMALRIRFVSLVAGLASLATVVLSVTPTRVLAQSGNPDPRQLPVATTAQVPLTTAYDAVKVPSMAAGSWYLDPTTNVKVYKLTSATFPTANSTGWRHDYAEGNNEISLPHTGTTRTIFVRVATYGNFWLFDFTPGVGVSNPRQLVAPFAPGGSIRDQEFTFSNDPATPYYAYVANGTDIIRIDVRGSSPTHVDGNGWPVLGEGNATWLSNGENDAFFVWMRNSNGAVVGYEPGTATKKVYAGTNASLINEPRMGKSAASRYVGMTLNVPDVNGLQGWNWTSNTSSFHQSNPPPFAHVANLRDRWYGSNFTASFPQHFGKWDPTTQTFTNLSGPSVSSAFHGSGMWVQPSTAPDDQWAIFTHYGSLSPIIDFGNAGWLAPGAIVFITANGQRRILAHPYNTSGTYEFLSFSKLAPDGKYVLFTSNMNGSGRSDVFLAELPAATNSPAPPTGLLVR